MPPAELRCEDINGSFLSIAHLILVTYVQNTCSARADACSYLDKFPWQGWAVGDLYGVSSITSNPFDPPWTVTFFAF